MSLVTYLFRRGCFRNDERRDAGLTVPENIEYIPDIAYGSHRDQTMDICRPKDIPSRAVIINVHGGGYVYGSTRTYKYYCCDLAARGYTVVSFNYRLAPRHVFPTPLYDLNAVMEWLCAHSEEYCIDLDNVLMVGDSAGAQLASQYAAIWSSAEYADIMGIRPPKFRLAALGLNCGMYDLAKVSTRKDRTSVVIGTYFTRRPERFGSQLNVLDYISADYPPAFLLSSNGDFLLENCRPMCELLRSRGVESEYRIYGDKDTGHVFHINIRSPLAAQANTDELEFMSRFIR